MGTVNEEQRKKKERIVQQRSKTSPKSSSQKLVKSKEAVLHSKKTIIDMFKMTEASKMMDITMENEKKEENEFILNENNEKSEISDQEQYVSSEFKQKQQEALFGVLPGVERLRNQLKAGEHFENCFVCCVVQCVFISAHFGKKDTKFTTSSNFIDLCSDLNEDEKPIEKLRSVKDENNKVNIMNSKKKRKLEDVLNDKSIVNSVGESEYTHYVTEGMIRGILIAETTFGPAGRYVAIGQLLYI